MVKRFTVILLVGISCSSMADEGMYLPFNLKHHYKDMVEKGLQLPYKKIYHAHKPSLKDAIVSLGGFCTAEIISKKGLLLTNHHCGYDAIREHSSPQNDYLTDGFWAASHKDEKPVEGLTASIVVRMEDVTSKIRRHLTPEMSTEERFAVVKRFSKALIKSAVKGTHYTARVKEFYGGNEFYLIVQEVFTDVRLVGAPPSSIGKYGGETDNWMWERHTGDFSLFRIYADRHNRPADFAMDNQPYVPNHHLPISIKGIQKGDFSMVMGYPGTTDRYLTSYGVQRAVDYEQPHRVKIRQKKLALMKANMNANDTVRIQYASTYAQVSNYWKYFIGQTEQLKRNEVEQRKRALEQQLVQWVGEDTKKRAPLYGSLLQDIAEAYTVLDAVQPTSVYYFESIYSIGINKFIINHYRLYGMLRDPKNNGKKINRLRGELLTESEDYWKNFDYTTEKQLLTAMFELYDTQVLSNQTDTSIASLRKRYKDWSVAVDEAMKTSLFSQRERYEAFVNNPQKEMLDSDELFQLNKVLLENYKTTIRSEEVRRAKEKLKRAHRSFIEALRKMQPDKKFYPDANFTLRLTYGRILDYATQEKQYNYYTTIEGLMAKEQPNSDEFTVSDRLKQLYRQKAYGRYGQDSTLWINFISDNDITGGNSGSPVINGKGELIGCAFDGNWEAMSGDIAFEEKTQRTISCDIRYILFIIDNYAGATHLIDEMSIVS